MSFLKIALFLAVIAFFVYVVFDFVKTLRKYRQQKRENENIDKKE